MKSKSHDSARTGGRRLPRSLCIAVLAVCCCASTISYAEADSSAHVVVAVGDISCDPHDSHFNHGQGSGKHCHMLATSNLAISMKPAAALILGDSQYESGALNAFQTSWMKSWGRDEL